MVLSAQRPHASKVFANELLHGAPVVKTLLMPRELRDMVQAKAAVMQGWIDAGRMAPGGCHAPVLHHLGGDANLRRF